MEDLHGAPLFSVENDILTEILFSLEENKINLFQYVYFLRFSFSACLTFWIFILQYKH